MGDGVGVAVEVGSGVGIEVGVSVTVEVGSGVGVGDGVGVAVEVGSGVGVEDGVSVEVGVGVEVRRRGPASRWQSVPGLVWVGDRLHIPIAT